MLIFFWEILIFNMYHQPYMIDFYFFKSLKKKVHIHIRNMLQNIFADSKVEKYYMTISNCTNLLCIILHI